jgi:nucleoside phosphorylase
MSTRQHPERKEIARFLLSRGIEREPVLRDARAPAPRLLATAAKRSRPRVIPFPAALAPKPKPLASTPAASAALPRADVVVITWTADEADALAYALTPAHGRAHWYPYKRRFGTYLTKIRPGAPARHAGRLASYFPITIGTQRVLCIKSELHLNQDGISEKGPDGKTSGRATLPVKDLFEQIIREAKPKLVLTIGTAGSVFDEFGLGDVVVTRAAKFRCTQEFRAEPFNRKRYTSKWKIPTVHFPEAEVLMKTFAGELAEPPVGPPTPEYGPGKLVSPKIDAPQIKLDGRDMKAFLPILTTDYFEYGTTTNRLDRFGAAVEMGDAVLGLVCSEMAKPPKWAIVRNMSDPVINGKLPAKKQFHLNEQTMWAVGFYTAYGKYTSIMGAIATWAIIAGLDGT